MQLLIFGLAYLIAFNGNKIARNCFAARWTINDHIIKTTSLLELELDRIKHIMKFRTNLYVFYLYVNSNTPTY